MISSRLAREGILKEVMIKLRSKEWLGVCKTERGKSVVLAMGTACTRAPWKEAIQKLSGLGRTI